MSELELLFKYLDAMGTLKVRATDDFEENSHLLSRRNLDVFCFGNQIKVSELW